jgi:hypothetical protein
MAAKTPAEQLLGLTLDGGWKVVEVLAPSSHTTGGNFSHGYIVQNARGMRAFLKALDYSRAMRAPDPPTALKALVDAYIFERDVLHRCREKHLDRVVLAIADGTARVAGEAVQYLILELAETDVRSQANTLARFEIAWTLRALHHVATGIFQLHREGIAHQDVKPSNILSFDGGRSSKLGDLGRAAYQGHTPPHEAYDIAGDPSYAPPELLYKYFDPDWNRRRRGCDLYLLGSMVVFFFIGIGTTPLLRKELHPAHCWGRWTGDYDGVLPYVRDAFGRVVDFVRQQLIDELKQDVILTVRELCEPDIRLRGHPLNRLGRGDPFSLERYISRFDLLARRAELGLLKK